MTSFTKTRILPKMNSPRLTFYLVLLLVGVGSVFASPRNVQSAVEQTPGGDSRLADTASRAQNTGGNFDFAASQWEKLIADFPESSLIGKAHFNAGICQVQTTEFRKAIKHLQLAIPKLEDEAVLKPHATFHLGFAQFKLGQNLKPSSSTRDESTALLTSATQTFAGLLKSHPKFSVADQACYFQGGAYEELGRSEDAVAAYEKIFEFDNPTFKFDGLFALADLQYQHGQYTSSVKYCEQFLVEADLSGGHQFLDDVNLLFGKALAKLATADEVAGDTSAAHEKLERATELFQQIAAQDPASKPNKNFRALADDARFQHAFCAVRLKQFDTAATLYLEIASHPDSPFAAESLAFAGQTLIEAGETDRAIETLKKSVAAESRFSPEASHWLASVYLKTKQPQKAYDLATIWIPKSKDSPVNVALLMDQADAAYDIPDRRKESIGLFDAIVDQHPEHKLAPSALYNSAVASLDTGDYQSAVNSADRLESQFKTSLYLPNALDVKAEAYLLSNQLAAATTALTRLMSDYPDHEKIAYWNLRSGLALYLQTKYSETIALLTPVLESFKVPTDKSEALHWVGASQFQLGQFSDAAENLSKSNQADATWRRADETLLLLCRAQLAANQIESSQTTAKQLVEKFPQSKVLSELYFRIGEQAYEAEQYEQAFANFEKVIQGEADSNFLPFSLYNAAWSQLKLDNFPDSNKLFTQLMERYPNHEIARRAIIGQSVARRKTGNPQSSIDDLKEFLKTAVAGPEQLEARYELGLSQVQATQWEGAVDTFQQLISDAAEDDRSDRFRYELAWAFKELKRDDEALEQFAQIMQDFADSPFAPEANFHIGVFAYDAEKYDDAILAFESCIQSKTSAAIREKAAYKLAWAYYKQEQFQQAHDRFASQVDLFPQGELFADGKFMVAESLFRLKKDEPAYTAYLAAQPAVNAATNIKPRIKWLTMLHGAQCANRLKKFSEALELVSPLSDSDAALSMQQDAWLEMGSAFQGLKQPEKALEFWEKASENPGKTGARACCLLGDYYFGNKQFPKAINQFRRVYFGFQGTSAPKDVRPWQAYAIYESARINFIQVSQAPQEDKAKLIDSAIKLFEQLLTDYPDDLLAAQTKKQLEELKKLKRNSGNG